MSGYWVAAEGKVRIPGGRMTDSNVGPAGLLHAVGDRDRVLCGARLRTLVEFRGMRWDTVGRGVARCPDCLAGTRSQPVV